MSLEEYRKKRQFNQTAEPRGRQGKADSARFVVQKHDASRLHYDFRLELDGVLKSWAVPKGPNLNPAVKALAVHVEDHPIEYASFEGTIPEGQYGGGTVMVWDEGTWEPEGDPRRGYERGSLTFRLRGQKLKGRWKLLQMHGKAGDEGKNWLLLKIKDDEAIGPDDRPIVDAEPRSMTSGRALEEIAQGSDATWTSNGKPAQARRRRAAGPGRAGAPGPEGEKPALPGARKTAMPKVIRPQLATLVREAPSGNEWIFELKFDGYRIICRKDDGNVVLRTRAGHDWTHRFPRVARAAAELDVGNALLDGEIVVTAPDGTTDFQALQNLMRRGTDEDLVYYVFDLPYYDGLDLTQVPLIERKHLLEKLVAAQDRKDRVIRYSDHLEGSGSRVFEHACRSPIEGLVAKRIDSPYEQRRSAHWVKLKCAKRQEFVIGGWSEPRGRRQGLGALLLGYYRNPQGLTYCGRVGTGFTLETLSDLAERLAPLATEEPPFVNPPVGRAASGAHWVAPRLVAEVEFGSWTRDDIVRHAVFVGLREDKTSLEVSREVAVDPPATARKVDRSTKGARSVKSMRLTNPDRVLYPEADLTKRDLAEYYASIADWILPHLVHRPLSLVRCPDGRQRTCFFQRHMGENMPEPIRGIEVPGKERTERCIAIDDAAGLAALAQIGALEIHPWGSREDMLDHPDRLIFDLDPGEGLDWRELVRAAREVRDRLQELSLTSFVRTSGGKGLHIVVPIERTMEWAPLKAFARAFATSLERHDPGRYIARMSKARRAGKIFVDYLRNDWGATAVASYSTRACPGATIATPLSWTELRAGLDPRAFTVRTIPRRLVRLRHDPWNGFFTLRQKVPGLLVRN
jgi:bifunctional non-homologous end joining protein LigD